MKTRWILLAVAAAALFVTGCAQKERSYSSYGTSTSTTVTSK
jgi:hypothetical protein